MKKLALLLLSITMAWQLNAQDSLQRIQVGLILPFSAKEVYQNPKHKSAGLSEACRQYFEGFTIAVDSLAKAGINVELLVYDTQLDTLTFKRILDKKTVQNCDLVFGPVMPAGTQMMKDFAQKNQVYHVSPLMTLTKSSINDPYLISAYPDLKYYANFIVESIKEQSKGVVNLVVLKDKTANDEILSKQILSLKPKYKEMTIRSLDLSKYLEYRNFYKLESENHVVIASENEFMVSSVMKHLSDTTQFLNLHTWSNRKVLDFKVTNLGQWQSINLNIVSPFYIDYSDSMVKPFLEKYRERYFTEPSEYAINGYEQAVYYISAFYQLHGEINKITELGSKRILSNFFEVKQKEGLLSRQNVGLNQLYFENYELKRYLKNSSK
jgi:hypothetical protein